VVELAYKSRESTVDDKINTGLEKLKIPRRSGIWKRARRFVEPRTATPVQLEAVSTR
jgi:hypothetical protein